jgi:hypothetical protein
VCHNFKNKKFKNQKYITVEAKAVEGGSRAAS